MEFEPLGPAGLTLIKPREFKDDRGYFFESFQAERYAAAGVPGPFVQDNVSRSTRGTLRGLHYQEPRGQAKLVSVLRGEILDVVVDLRRGSPTFGTVTAVTLSDENHWQLYVPVGFAHGFLVLSDVADVHYKCDGYYAPGCERGVRFDCPTLAVAWPGDPASFIVSPKDAVLPALADIAPDALPRCS